MRNEAHRLYIDGVASPIVAERLDRRAGSATMEQSLPFLEIGTIVADDEGNTYTIRGVELALRDGVPRLRVALDPEDSMIRARPEQLGGTRAERGATLTFERPQLLAAREVVISDVAPRAQRPETAEPSTQAGPLPASGTSTARLYQSAPPAIERDSLQAPHPTFLITRVDRWGFAVQRFLLEFARHVREAVQGLGRTVDRLVEL